MSKAAERRRAHGEKRYVVDRKGARRRAFGEGLRLLQSDPSFRRALIDGTAPHWTGMEVLNKPERFKIRQDLKVFARATEAERLKAIERARNPEKIGFIEKVKRAFMGTLGA